MKKAICFLITVFLLAGCVAVRTVDFSRVTFGMSKAQVRDLIGAPERVLAARQTNQGYQEVLQYRTPYDEVYAFEFWNDRLTGYQHLYDDGPIYVPGPPPVVFPPVGHPIFPDYPPSGKPRPQPAPPVRPSPTPRPPSRPENPTQPSRPNPGTSNPTQPSRPGPSTPDRPGASNPVTPSRPATSAPTTRPGSSTSSSPAQSTRPAQSSESSTSNTRESNTGNTSSGTGTVRSTEGRR
ncbi:hypothetical protein LJB95_03445 [Paludibacteraceae bacterium OttesenSCG-928-F17]|nr:hypothetical protein [Paludibacteraceae bacterium OttesenSCG-928-F17]